MEFKAKGNDVVDSSFRPMVSIIVPVYRPDIAMLERAITSCLSQSYSSFEVILIDDGNTLEDLKVIYEMTKLDNRIRVVESEHLGVSCARNLGINCARGDYICFLDSDDELNRVFLAEAIQMVYNYNLTAVFGACLRCPSGKGGESLDFVSAGKVTVVEGPDLNDLSNYFFSYRAGKETSIPKWLSHMPGAKLVESKCLKNVRFPRDLRYSEDGIFFSEVVLRCEKVGVVQHEWYKYYQNAGSAMHAIEFGPSINSYCNAIKGHAQRLGKREIDYYSNITIHLFVILKHCVKRENTFSLEKLRIILRTEPFISAFESAIPQEYYMTKGDRVRFELVRRNNLHLLRFCYRMYMSVLG